MMGFGGYRGMMDWSSGSWGWFGGMSLIFWLVLLIDLILLGMWLFKQIQKK